MRTLHVIGFRNDGTCDFLAKPTDKIEDVIKLVAEMATSKNVGDFIRAEVYDSERGRSKVIFGTAQPKHTKTESKMKKATYALVFFALLAASALTASAQVYSPQTIFSWKGIVGLTNSGMSGAAYTPGAAWGIPTSQTTNALLDCRKQDSATVQYSMNCNTNIAHTNWFVWSKSVDGSSWDYTNLVKHQMSWIPAAAGNAITLTTNLSCTGIGYWKLYWMSNDCEHADGVIQDTNIVIKYGIKIPR